MRGNPRLKWRLHGDSKDSEVLISVNISSERHLCTIIQIYVIITAIHKENK